MSILRSINYNEKIPSPLQILYFLFFPPLLLWWFFKNLVLLPPNCLNFSFPQFKKGGGLETICIHQKISEIIFAFLRVFPLEHFDVVFYSCLLFDMVFVKNLPHFHGQIKQKAGNRFHFPTKNNKLIESQIKGLLTFWEVKFFAWFKHIGYKRIQFRMSCAWHECILHTI